MSYEGLKEVQLTQEEIANIYETKQFNKFKLYNNEYLVIKDENGEYIDRFRFDGEKLIHFTIKNLDNPKLKPRNFKQQCCFDLLQNDKIPIKLITGSMGSGKTFLTFNHALYKLNKGLYNKIVYVRNNIDVKDTSPIGALPNGIKDKLFPYIMPLADIISNSDNGFVMSPIEKLDSLEKQDKLEYLHLGFARGRSFSKTIIIVSEAENLTREHVALLIGRVGDDSIIIFEGDISQVDKKVFENKSGIKALKEVLGGNELFGCVHMDKSERSIVADLSSLF